MERIWHKYYTKGVPKTLSFREVTLPEAFQQAASKYADRPALIFQDTIVTFRELEQMVARFASALKAMGVRPGDRVSLILPNLVQTAVGVYGTMRLGGVAVMHNPRLDDLQLEFQLRDAGSTVLICLDVLIPRMLNLRARTGVKKIISCHIRDYLPFLKKQLFPFVKSQLHMKTPEDANVAEFTELLDTHQPALRGGFPQLDDLAFILYTSATTGRAKGVELSHRNLSFNVQQARSWFPNFVDGMETVVGCLPFFHSFGLTCALNMGIFYGFTDILVPLPEPKNIIEAAAKYKPTFMPALPNLYIAIVNDPKLQKCDLSGLKGCFSGGAPLPLQTIRSFEKLYGVPICEGYGLTECSPVSHINPLGGKTKVGTIGMPLPDTDAKIVDVSDFQKEITVLGTPGELCIRGPQIMRGYHNLPEQTAEALKDGWLLTGDVVTMDAEGYFTVVDRKKDMIVSEGQKIYPRDVEEVLFSHPKISDACAIGVRDQEKGEAVKAFVVLKKGTEATAAEIVAYCQEKLPPHHVPQQVDFIDDLPRSPVGKVLRKELKRRHLVRSSAGAAKTSR